KTCRENTCRCCRRRPTMLPASTHYSSGPFYFWSRRGGRARRFMTPGSRAQLQMLEKRTLLAVSIINGGGSGYLGNGGGGPPDVTGAAGPSSYLEITNSTVTLFSPKGPSRTISATRGINDFLYNPLAGNQTRIDLPFSGALIPIAASPTGATEAGNTVT